MNFYLNFMAEHKEKISSLEVFLMVLACGKVPEQFKVTLSKRNDISKILHIV